MKIKPYGSDQLSL